MARDGWHEVGNREPHLLAPETRGRVSSGRAVPGGLPCGERGSARGINQGALYIGVLVGGDGNELRLGERECLNSARLVGILRPVFVHLHHMQARLVLVKGLQNHHLSGMAKGGRGTQGEKKKLEREGRGERCPLAAASPGRLRTSLATPDSGVSLGKTLRDDEARGKIKCEGFLTTPLPLLFSPNDTV